MPNSMLFVEQAIRMLLKEEGPMERELLIRQVYNDMKLPDLEPFIESTLGLMIGKNEVKFDEDGKLHL
ncbi:hypothetical protein A3K01_04150 [candidate division WWE3 bacterium RIFOXYD1_FULL_43_17]|uniref:Uncharacterized protein n=2 Tax=Katanobacteria TaxID=422282 RepID=A0A1F4XE02_UNCKA|nr:MAG: hypothetical protein UU59_C0015G0009 [candidate division WWE3 bacterium GW2011_GWE1_41_27]OGC79884.1 MAG: hypothetical protein A3K01_04150 [candidate division WWE3 bacterium RIFOXYD1_FULL_43_17]